MKESSISSKSTLYGAPMCYHGGVRSLNAVLMASRWLMIVPVFSLVVGAGYFTYLTALDVFKGVTAGSPEKTTLLLIHALDSSLLTAVMILFALGLFELFVGTIDVPEDHPFRRVLVIESLDDLKGKLATVLVMLIFVKFFEEAQDLQANNFMDLLLLAGGVALLGVGLWLTRK
jgi:uncharacterized membrane protein YqhA